MKCVDLPDKIEVLEIIAMHCCCTPVLLRSFSALPVTYIERGNYQHHTGKLPLKFTRVKSISPTIQQGKGRRGPSWAKFFLFVVPLPPLSTSAHPPLLIYTLVTGAGQNTSCCTCPHSANLPIHPYRFIL